MYSRSKVSFFSILLVCISLRLCLGKVVFSVGNYARKYTPCGVSGNYSKVGFRGSFTGDVSGDLFIFDDCYFAITNFTYPSKAPVLTPYGGLFGQSPVATYAFQINPIKLTGHSPSDTIVIYSQWAFTTWDNIQIIYAWDSKAMKSYGEVYVEEVSYTSALNTEVKEFSASILNAAKEENYLASPPPPFRAAPPPLRFSSSPGGAGAYSGFDNCFTPIRDTLNIYWKADQNNSAISIEYGIEARVGLNSWIGFGFSSNLTTFQMKDSDVTIVGWIEGEPVGFAQDFFITTKQACQFIAGGYVGACPDTLLGGTSKLDNVQLVSSERRGDVTYVRYKKLAKTSDSRWDVDLTSLPLTSSHYVVFASGPLAPTSTNKAPILLYHNPSQGYFFNGSQISLKPLIPSFNCTPLLGSKEKPHPVLPPFTFPPPPASPPPPPSINACNRTIEYKGTNKTYETCNYLFGGFVLLWTLDGTTLDAAFAASLDNPNGWAGVGISPTGDITGSSILVAFKSSSGQVEPQQYIVNAPSSNSVVPGGNLKTSNLEGEIVNSTQLAFLFTLELSPEETSAAYLVWTKGSNVTNSVLSQDGIDDALSSVVSFSSGSTTSGYQPDFDRWKAHGVMSAIAWGVIFPIGALMGRHMRRLSTHWYVLHQGTQIIGYCMAQVGFVIAVTMAKKHPSLYSTHRAVGIFLFVVTTLQVLAILWKPGSDSKLRKYWRKYHLIVAILVLLLGIVQIFLGFKVSDAHRAFMYVYIVWVVFLLIFLLFLEIYFRFISPPPHSETLELIESGKNKADKKSTSVDSEKDKKAALLGSDKNNNGKGAAGPSSDRPDTPEGSDSTKLKLPPRSDSISKVKNVFSGPISENLRKFNLLPRRQVTVKADKFNVKATMTGTPDFLIKRKQEAAAAAAASASSSSSSSSATGSAAGSSAAAGATATAPASSSGTGTASVGPSVGPSVGGTRKPFETIMENDPGEKE